jgi:hypothetical protein
MNAPIPPSKKRQPSNGLRQDIPIVEQAYQSALEQDFD